MPADPYGKTFWPGLPMSPGCQAGPDPGRRRHAEDVRRSRRRGRRPPRGPAGHDHRADRPQRRRQDARCSTCSRGSTPDTGTVVVRRQLDRQGPHRLASGDGAHLPAHQVAHQDERHREHELGARRPAGGDPSGVVPLGWCGAPGTTRSRSRRTSSSSGSGSPHARRVRRNALRRTAQAARDGPGADGRARRWSCSTSRWPGSTRR